MKEKTQQNIPHPPTDSNWEEDFEKYYAWVLSCESGPTRLKAFKDFIKNLIQSEREKEREKMIEEIKKKWNCHQVGCDWNRNRVYGNKVCDMNCNNVLEIIKNKE